MASFNSAFAAARKAGKKTFSWNGKSYTTKLASGSPKTPKKGPVPTPRPSKANPKSKPSAKAKQDYPRPAKSVGIASASSPIGRSVARADNAPVTKRQTKTVAEARREFVKAKADKAAATQGPVPEGVWYARKGSAMSKAAARRANKPVPKKPSGGGW